MKRLVEIDPVTMYAKEVDHLRLKREAKDLRKYLLTISGEDRCNIKARVLPIVEAAINGTRHFPISPEDEPLKYEIIEGLVSEYFHELYARFFNTAIGARVDLKEIQEKDGKSFAWTDFYDK